jgi:hypothetical protein
VTKVQCVKCGANLSAAARIVVGEMHHCAACVYEMEMGRAPVLVEKKPRKMMKTEVARDD